MTQRSRLKSVGKTYFTFVRYVVGGVMIVIGSGVAFGSGPIYIKPFGFCLSIAGGFLLPIVGRLLADRSRQFARWYNPPIAAVGTLVIGFALTVVASTAWDSAHPEHAAKREAQRKAEEQGAQARDAKEQARKALQQQVVAKEAQSNLQSAVTAMWGQVTSYIEPCEKSQRYLADVLGRPGALVQSYQMASQGQQVCFQARSGLQAITVPEELSQNASKLAAEGLSGCADALLARMTFMTIATKVIDGDRRPSKLAEAQAQNQAADMATLQCVAKLTEAAQTDGISLEKP